DIEQTLLERLDANLDKYYAAIKERINAVAGEQNGENAGDFNNNPGNISHSDFRNIPSMDLHDVRLAVYTIEGKSVAEDSLLPGYVKHGDSNLKQSEFLTTKISGRKYRLLRSPVQIEEDTLYAVEVAASMEPINASLRSMTTLFLIIIPLALIITGVMAYIISVAAFKPITRMAKEASLISGNNLDKKLELPRSRDEIRILGETLNEMIKRIELAFKSQKQFIANASHEIKTPLTIIQTELELALRNAKDKESSESLRVALSETESLGALTNSLLTLISMDSFKSSLRIEKFRLDELLIDCIYAMKQTASQKSISINFNLAEAVELSGDKEKLKRVFESLIDNAVKYTNYNGAVMIELKSLPPHKTEIIFSDNGLGIDAAEISKIFERFYRSDNVRSGYTGSGLGLAIAKEIIAMHKGEINVQSELGKGTKVTVILPVAKNI
ncbi:MAG: HAMP domain-containing histidine kinase, partial [Bacteroidetes bacterium]|nr:HAMP domain-containing histidine kinase [Bacteroidota bacterium]